MFYYITILLYYTICVIKYYILISNNGPRFTKNVEGFSVKI